MPAEARFPYRQKIVVICGKTGTGKTTLSNLVADKMERKTGIRPTVGSTDQFKRKEESADKPTEPRAYTPEERLPRYKLLADWLTRELEKQPGHPIVLQGMFDHPDFRKVVEDAAGKNSIDYVEVRAPPSVCIQRLQEAEKRGKDRGGSKANSRMLKKSPGWPEFHKLDRRFALVDNPGDKTEEQLDADAGKIVDKLAAESMAERVTRQRIQKEFEKIDGEHRAPMAKLRSALTLARNWFGLTSDGTISLWGIHPDERQPYQFDRLKLWAAIYPQPPYGSGFSAMKKHGLGQFVISIHDFDRRRTSLYYRSGQPAHVTEFGGGTFDPKIHRDLSRGGRILPHGMYFPVGWTTNQNMEAENPLFSAPHWYKEVEEPFELAKKEGHLGIASSYCVTKRTDEHYTQMNTFFDYAEPWIARWMGQHLMAQNQGPQSIREAARQADRKSSGKGKKVAALARLLTKQMPEFDETQRVQIRAAARILPLIEKDNPQKWLPNHSPNHPIVTALLGFQHLNGVPQAYMVDSQGREKNIANLGEFGQLDPEQRKKVETGQISVEGAWTHNIQKTSIHGGNEEKVDAFQENRTENGSLSPEDVISIANNMYRLRTRQPEPDEIPTSAHVLQAAWLLQKNLDGKRLTVQTITRAKTDAAGLAEEKGLKPETVNAIKAIRAEDIRRAVRTQREIPSKS